MKTTMNEINNAIDCFKSRLNQVKKRIYDLEDRFLDIIQSEENQ